MVFPAIYCFPELQSKAILITIYQHSTTTKVQVNLMVKETWQLDWWGGRFKEKCIASIGLIVVSIYLSHFNCSKPKVKIQKMMKQK